MYVKFSDQQNRQNSELIYPCTSGAYHPDKNRQYSPSSKQDQIMGALMLQVRRKTI